MGQIAPPADLSVDPDLAVGAPRPRISPTIPDAPIPARREAPWVLRLALGMGLVVSLALGLTLSRALAPAPAMEADLLRLLRGMVVIKGLIALSVGALVWWRLGRPIRRAQTLGYGAALCLSAAALGWLWGLHLVMVGSLFFYAGLIGVSLAAGRDPLLSDWLPKGRRGESAP